ncbi:FAD-dependent oxidoreductase [Streptomyces sp. NPDC007084]|uniref:FAD-dependent oxidoreductase n=1 Tax=Streptomyces sp. NPDC007084 TaxID=3154313 RepID=UPI0034516475
MWRVCTCHERPPPVSARRVVVIGGGVMGSAAAWRLAGRGDEVTLLERFWPGHDRGSSHGTSRIFRLAYADPFYVDLAVRALPLWREAEEVTGRRVLTLTGAVDHGPSAVIEALREALSRAGRPAERLAPEQVAERWPGLRADTSALFHPEAGRLHADEAVAAFQQAARDRGARVRHGARVTGLSLQGEGAAVRVEGEDELRADAVVVAAGSWTASLLTGDRGPLRRLPALRVTQEQPVHFPAGDALSWPSFIHHPGAALPAAGRTVDGVYGLGSVDGVKAGFHGIGPVADPDHRDRTPDPGTVAALAAYAERWLPGVRHTAPDPLTCLYTTTVQRDFIADRQGPVTVLGGCSGHAFKFAPVLGELAAALVHGSPGPDRFTLNRP